MYIHIDAINTYSRTCLSYQYALSGTSPLLFFCLLFSFAINTCSEACLISFSLSREAASNSRNTLK